MKKYRLETLVDGQWRMHGLYTGKFISQMAQAVSDLRAKGFEMYKTMRLVEVTDDGKSNIPNIL